MTCGKICCGKTTYARRLSEERNAVILSIDDVMLSLFPEGAGEMHDMYVLRVEKYLLSLSLRILRTGVDVILDWGLWTAEQRRRIRLFYQEQGVKSEIHYLRISPAEWERRIIRRNSNPDADAYFVDEGLIQKVDKCFKEPASDEVDRIIDA